MDMYPWLLGNAEKCPLFTHSEEQLSPPHPPVSLNDKYEDDGDGDSTSSTTSDEGLTYSDSDDYDDDDTSPYLLRYPGSVLRRLGVTLTTSIETERRELKLRLQSYAVLFSALDKREQLQSELTCLLECQSDNPCSLEEKIATKDVCKRQEMARQQAAQTTLAMLRHQTELFRQWYKRECDPDFMCSTTEGNTIRNTIQEQVLLDYSDSNRTLQRIFVEETGRGGWRAVKKASTELLKKKEELMVPFAHMRAELGKMLRLNEDIFNLRKQIQCIERDIGNFSREQKLWSSYQETFYAQHRRRQLMKC
ncbi:hypothetical protein CALVIDRAFT_531918 [Calocera viscosa TUFC12733]|uniref:Uncharacterized protein n=1 Tax=Calocera viscosa (strain TUFC12733) TaxID=1330018 RepID=A0A167FKD0_CALVF|nr:hypothetical protein CALVIDRAFT_531992 [Calocera viscosa TUFC12733]KZO89705.1 hypothetical protein CALVIDRAFT_531918 [Calocera viscosa TUFC12733]